MAEEQNEIEIRSDEVQEIMSHVPNWMIRWGISLIFILILLFMFLSWLIKYPDIITGSIELTTEVAPIKVVSKQSSEIDKIYFSNNSDVKKGETLVLLKNQLNAKAKEELKEFCNLINQYNKEDKLTFLNIPRSNYNYGILQTNYSNLVQSINEYQLYINQSTTTFNISNIKEQITQNLKLKDLANNQLRNSKNQLQNTQQKFNSDKLLYEKGVISKITFFEEQKKLISAQSSVDNINKEIVQIALIITKLKKELNDIESNHELQKKQLKQAINKELKTISNELQNWKKNYIITSPITGKMVYDESDIYEHKFIEQNKNVLTIVPNNQSHIGYLKVNKQGYGKIKLNQKVRIKLDNYPFHEFGLLNGVVSEISLIPNEESYIIKIQLSNGLITNYNKPIQYQPQMSGVAEIVTEDLRIIERVFNQFRKIFVQ